MFCSINLDSIPANSSTDCAAAAADGVILPTLNLTFLLTFDITLQSSTSVYVSTANAPASDHLLVGGYDVSGEVRSDGEPMKEVTFLLYSDTVKREVRKYLTEKDNQRLYSYPGLCKSIFFEDKMKFFCLCIRCCQDVSGCNASPVEGADLGDSSLSYICSALSQDDGTFAFPSLASGKYTVVSCPHFTRLKALLKPS